MANTSLTAYLADGYSAHAVGHPAYTRGAPVLAWAGPRIREDKELVQFLVWANPSNLCFAGPALQADIDVVAAALASPFYAEQPALVPPSCVLRFAGEQLRASKELVLAAVARSGYEVEFAAEALRADPHVVAWAGAPVGAADTRGLSKTFMRLLKCGVTVEHMDANWKRVLEDEYCRSKLQGTGFWAALEQWPKLPPGMPLAIYTQWNSRHALCFFLREHLRTLAHCVPSASASRRPCATCCGRRARTGTGCFSEGRGVGDKNSLFKQQ